MILILNLNKMESKRPHQRDFPDKLYYKIGEVSEIAGVPTYVLRFWETEFKKIKPKRTPAGQRLYRKKDVDLVLKIKYLLYNKKFTIQGAKQHLRGYKKDSEEKIPAQTLHEIRSELENIRALLMLKEGKK